MARKVKCQVTGEIGTNETFFKVDNKYYKSQEIYEKHRKEKELWNEIIRYICEDLLGYASGQVFPSLVVKKLNEYKFYEREVILKAFKDKEKNILYQINQSGKFDNDNGKIFYMFAIIKNSINDTYKEWKREEKEIQNYKKEIRSIEILDTVKHENKDISSWLGEDEL